MSEINSVSSYLKAQENAGQLRAKAREELDEIIADARRQLELLGEEHPQSKKQQANGQEKHSEKNGLTKRCKICDVTGHDLRAHRTHPEKFDANELAQLQA